MDVLKFSMHPLDGSNSSVMHRVIVLHPMNRLEKENIAEINSLMRSISQRSGLSDYENCQSKQETVQPLLFFSFFFVYSNSTRSRSRDNRV